MSTASPITHHLTNLLAHRSFPKTICPSEVARALTSTELRQLGFAGGWRDAMPAVRDEVWRMREEGEVEVLQGGEVVEDGRREGDVRGPIRVRRRVKSE